MKNCFILLAIGLSLIFANAAFATNYNRYGVGARLQLSNWKGDNNGSSQDYNANATQLAVSFHYQFKRFYSGLSLQSGSFSFTNGVPEMNSKTTSTTPTNDSATIERGEADLLAGYYFWSHVSLFLDAKSITNTWRDLNYNAKYTGLGIGVSGFVPLPNNWTFYASFGIIPLKVSADGDNIGDGSGSTLELGMTYAVNKHHNLGIGIKSQSQSYNFDNDHKQKQSLGGLTLAYNFNF